jgi:hypothetical protein
MDADWMRFAVVTNPLAAEPVGVSQVLLDNSKRGL